MKYLSLVSFNCYEINVTYFVFNRSMNSSSALVYITRCSVLNLNYFSIKSIISMYVSNTRHFIFNNFDLSVITTSIFTTSLSLRKSV